MSKTKTRLFVLLLIVLSVSGLTTRILAYSPNSSNQNGSTHTQPTTNTPSVFNGYVKNTLILNNATLQSGNVAPFNGFLIDRPSAAAYDSRDNLIFVTSGLSIYAGRSNNNVAVIDASTNKMTTELHVLDPRGITYDPTNDYLYVASGTGATVINGATRANVANVSLGVSSSGIAYDPSNDRVYVSGYSSSSVAIVDATNYSVVGNVTVGGNPTGIAVDPDNKNIYVNCLQSGMVSIINGGTNKVTNVTIIPSITPSTTTRPFQPPFQDIAYDQFNGRLYLADFLLPATDQGVVYVLDAASNNYANFTGVESVGAIAYDPANNLLYLTSAPNSVNSIFYGNTLLAADPTTDQIVANVTVGSGPIGIAYDDQNSAVYTADSRSDSVSVLDTSTNTVKTTIFPQAFPNAVAYDSRNGLLYVANEGSYVATFYKDSWSTSIVSVNVTSGEVQPINIGMVGPFDLLYDPSNNYLYVATLQGTIAIVDASTNTVLGTLQIPGIDVAGMAYDPVHHRIYVANNSFMPADSVVYVIDDTTNTLVDTVHAGLCPLGLAYDSGNDGVYVTHYCVIAGNAPTFVTMIDGATDQVVANVTVGSRPTGILYDSKNNAVYVADASSNEISVISDTTNTVTATIPVKMYYPEGLILDPANNQIIVTNLFPEGGINIPTNTTEVIDAKSNSLLGNFTLGYNPTDGAYDPSTGYLYVSNYYSGTISIISPFKATTVLAVSCTPSPVQTGTFTTCTVSATGASPTGVVTLASNSATGSFFGPCDLSAGACSALYTDAASSNTTAQLTASYAGDVHNAAATLTYSIDVFKSSNTLATASSKVKMVAYAAKADQTRKTGILVEVAGTAEANGTEVVINTRDLSSPDPGIGPAHLQDAKYYDVSIRGVTRGTATVCIKDLSADSHTTMEAWYPGWQPTFSVTTNAGMLCGSVDVSVLSGANIAVGDTIPPAPLIPGFGTPLFYAIFGALVVVVIVAAALLFRHRTRAHRAL